MASEGGETNTDVAQLRKAWESESVCPEVLPFERELVEVITELVSNQEDVLEDIEQTSDQAFSANLYQMEIERIKFSLAKYLRTRLLKIEKFAWKYERDEQFREKLSEAEHEYARQYIEIKGRHFNETLLKHLPDEFQHFPERTLAEEEVINPHLDTYVFALVRDGVEGEVELEEDGGHTQLNEKEVHVIRYPPIQALVGHQIDLI